MKNQGCTTSGSTDSSSEKKRCCADLFNGMLVGSLVMFAYLFVSWFVLPWHKSDLQTFSNPGTVAAALATNVSKPGLYVLTQQPQLAVKGKKAAAAPSGRKLFAFAALAQADDPMRELRFNLTLNFLIGLVSSLLLTGLIKKGTCCGGCPVAFSMVVGLVVAFSSYLPPLVWFHFPLHYTLVGMLDNVLSFTLAGAAISRFVLNAGDCTMGKGASSCSTGKDNGKKSGGCH